MVSSSIATLTQNLSGVLSERGSGVKIYPIKHKNGPAVMTPVNQGAAELYRTIVPKVH